MMFDIAITLLISIIEKQVQKSRDKGKPMKALKKIFSEDTQQKVGQFYQAYTLAAIELEDELFNED